MAKKLNGPAMTKRGPWAGSLCQVASADMGDGFPVPVWVLVAPTGGVAVIRMNQGKAAESERAAYYAAKEAAETVVAEEMARELVRDLTEYERTNDPDYKASGKDCECKVCKALIYSEHKVAHIKNCCREMLNERLKAQDAAQEQKKVA